MRLDRALALVSAVLLATGCSSGASSTSASAAAPAGPSAKATIEARSGSSLTGTAVAREAKGAVTITVDVAGIPEGVHAVHIHEKGDCSAPDAASAGPHFNPTNAPHAAPDAAQHHAGDFGNMTVGKDGKGHLEITSSMLTVAAGANSVVGRAIIVHGKPDDLQTQPAGNAGPRIGCGLFQ